MSPPGFDKLAEWRLIRDAQRGDQEALETLFRRHWPRAHRAAFLIVQDAPAAEDIAQEAFLAAIRSLDRFDLRRPFAPWLHRIVVNRAIDLIRARKLRREVRAHNPTGGGEEILAVEPAIAHAAGSAGQLPFSDETMTAIAALPVDQRAVVVLRYALEYTPGEIAAALDLPRGTVNSRLRRALDRLSDELGVEG